MDHETLDDLLTRTTVRTVGTHPTTGTEITTFTNVADPTRFAIATLNPAGAAHRTTVTFSEGEPVAAPNYGRAKRLARLYASGLYGRAGRRLDRAR